MLLRVLDERKMRRLGGKEETSIDIRFIVLTNKNLVDEVNANRFRPDLYARISCFHYHVPPLRERREDILPLAQYFLKIFGKKRGISHLDSDLQKRFQSHDWPFNIRELRDAIRRGSIRSKGPELTIEDVYGHDHSAFGNPFPQSDSKHGFGFTEFPLTLAAARDEMMRSYLERLMRFTRGNITEASIIAGIRRETLHKLLRKYGFDARKFRD
jgi:DNA-binding NtrC family response regulator